MIVNEEHEVATSSELFGLNARDICMNSLDLHGRTGLSVEVPARQGSHAVSSGGNGDSCLLSSEASLAKGLLGDSHIEAYQAAPGLQSLTGLLTKLLETKWQAHT